MARKVLDDEWAYYEVVLRGDQLQACAEGLGALNPSDPEAEAAIAGAVQALGDAEEIDTGGQT